MKHISILAALLFVTIFPGVEAQVIDKTIAIVGNEIITQSELDIKLLQISIRNPEEYKKDPLLRSRLLDAMVTDKLILAQADLDSVVVSDEEVNAQVESQLKSMEQTYGSRERLEQAAGMPLTQLRREFREEVRKNLLVRQVQMNRFGSMVVSHREVEDFFAVYKDSLPQVPEQVELRQITMFPKILDDFKQAARKRAIALLDSIKHGADFSDLARRYSEDVGSAKNGGRLGTARRGVFVREFEEAVFALQPGETSGVVESPFGFHIIHLMERKGESVNAQHILIRVQRTGESDSSTIQVLQSIREQVMKGEDFGRLAQKHSEDSQTRTKGGSLGLVEVEQLSSEMQQAQQSLAPNAISAPFKVTIDRDYAYAIVQLVKRISPHTPTMENDYARIASFAKIVKQNKDYVSWINSLRTSLYWKVYQ
jgi:peptidyl-prolyl cis-trans isomerase SurA